MRFYDVLVASSKYHGRGPLTYEYPGSIDVGSVVQVPLGKNSVSGIVLSQSPVPDFVAKPIEHLIAGPLPSQSIQLCKWIGDYYPGSQGPIAQLFIPNSLQVRPKKHKKPTLDKQSLPDLPPPNEGQMMAIQQILEGSGPFLLHGETGVGKTRIYQELVRATVEQGKSALVLTPEIGLSPHLTTGMEQIEASSVINVHSGLTPAKRRDNWLAIHESSLPLIVTGARSALFSPIKNLGIIIVDESHDTAYKNEQSPNYHANIVASKLARLHEAKLVFGSATPQVQDYFIFKEKKLPIIRLTEPAIKGSSVNIDIIDSKDRGNFSKSKWLSDSLIDHIRKSLSLSQQSLIFLNRRGTARIVVCQNCAWQANCRNCDLPLTYHGDTHILRCHTCGIRENALNACPDCGSADIRYKSAGTKTIVDEIKKIFPKAKILRLDSDSNKSDGLNNQYEQIKDGHHDILVGTQMISKGLDLPKLSVVGIVSADTSLSFPDYTADERTFQIIRQVIGRVGRGHLHGNVLIQTLQPDNPTILNASNKDYDEFYKSQLKERSLYKFPPYCYVLKISIERTSQINAQKSSRMILDKILALGLKIQTSDPLPAFTEKSLGKYKWQIIIKSRDRSRLTEVIGHLPSTCSYDIDPVSLL